jgi:hypothetical protein
MYHILVLNVTLGWFPASIGIIRVDSFYNIA